MSFCVPQHPTSGVNTAEHQSNGPDRLHRNTQRPGSTPPNTRATGQTDYTATPNVRGQNSDGGLSRCVTQTTERAEWPKHDDVCQAGTGKAEQGMAMKNTASADTTRGISEHLDALWDVVRDWISIVR